MTYQMFDNASRAVALYLIKRPLISMRYFITYNVTARDLWISTSGQQLTQQMVDEYLMFFQSNTRSEFTIAQN